VHERSCEFQPSAGFALRVWDEVYAPETGGWLDQLLAGTAFDDASRSVILTSAERLGSILQRFPKSKDTYGAIHADFHLDNLMFDGTNVWIIDFEDAGWGHFLFDLTWPGALSAKHNEGSRFLELFRAGYEQVRPLCAVDNDALAGFLLAAGIGVLDMVHTSPVANESRVAREWFSFAVDWLGKNLAACDQSFR
jgi:Ser/Thr protein kinase RdoA (MazF antagonist)